MSWKVSVALYGLVEKKFAQLVAARAKMVALKIRRDEASARTAACPKNPLQAKKGLVTAFEDAKNSSARVVAMAKKQNAVPTKNKVQRSSVEQRVGFLTNKWLV